MDVFNDFQAHVFLILRILFSLQCFGRGIEADAVYDAAQFVIINHEMHAPARGIVALSIDVDQTGRLGFGLLAAQFAIQPVLQVDLDRTGIIVIALFDDLETLT